MKPAKPKPMKPRTLYTIVDADGHTVYIDGWDMVGCTKARDAKRELQVGNGERIARVLITEVTRGVA